MTPLFLALALLDPTDEPMPEPYTLYHQALACAVSAGIEMDRASPPGDETVEGALAWSYGAEEVLAWGMVMAHAGPLAGRSPEDVDSGDAEKAELFFREMLEKRPEAFGAHRAYCRAFQP